MIEKLINLRRLMSLLTSLSLVVIACPFVCGYACLVRFFVCVCCMPRFVPLFVSASTVSVSVLGLLALLSVSAVCAYAWVVHLYFLIFLL